VEEATAMAVAAFAIEQPAFGQVRVSNELRKRSIFISPLGVRAVWLRRNLTLRVAAGRSPRLLSGGDCLMGSIGRLLFGGRELVDIFKSSS
jgi:hypothetical protein